MSLNDTVALVAGASGEIGRAIVVGLLEAGAEVFMLGRSMEKLVRASLPKEFSAKRHFIEADLTDGGSVRRVAADISAKGRLDVLVLSSGIYERSHEPAVLASQIAANVVGPYSLIQHLLPFLIGSKGQVVFINSTQGLRAGAGVGQYAATKHAMKAIADSMRDEVNGSSVRVASIFLGRTATERQRTISAAEGRPYQPERLIQPADVAKLVLFLLQLPRTSEVTDVVLRPMQKT
jgi:NADP-dependent 3-hydroxy acid dehydrogenase YdfG